MNTLEKNLQEWMLRNGKTKTYGELLEASRGNNDDLMDNFYTESERKLRNEIIKSDKERLLKLG